ncbi:MAG: substrate-binding domain-containing protein [Candidatus Bathyarchaeia archaeon]
MVLSPAAGRGMFPRRGYVLLLAGILIGFLVFASISFVFSRAGPAAVEAGIPGRVEFEFLYTSEKQGWIEEVTPGFREWFKSRFGIEVSVRLVVTGSHKTVNLILLGSSKPAAWSPASSIWIPYLNAKWRSLGHLRDIAVDWTSLVVSPAVIAGWRSFLEANDIRGYRDLIRLSEEGISFRYGHPDPQLSNGGVMAAMLEFAAATGKPPESLTVGDLTDEDVLSRIAALESRAVAYGESTGFFGSWAAENGPAAIDVFTVYESVVIDNALKAERKWGDPLVAVYPEDGVLLSDHPYVLLDAEWVTPWQRFAAAQYLLYLLTPQVQERAQLHGFRPANPSVPLDSEIFNPSNGVKLDLEVPVLRPPSGEVMEAMLEAWVKVRNPGV